MFSQVSVEITLQKKVLPLKPGTQQIEHPVLEALTLRVFHIKMTLDSSAVFPGHRD